MAVDFRVQGVDLTGFGQAIAQGIEGAARMNLLREQEFKKEVDNFEKNYNNENLKTDDIPDFTSAFQEYREKALKYSRANKGMFGKADNISLLYKDMEDAKVKMNNIYSNSAKSKQYVDSLAKYSTQLTNKGYRIPKEISDRYDYFLKTPSSMIKDEDYVNPYEIDLKPTADSYSRARKIVGMIPLGTDPNPEVEDIEDEVPGIGKVKIRKTSYSKSRDPYSVLYASKTALNAEEGVYNDYKTAADEVITGLSLTPEQIAENPDLATVKAKADGVYAQIQSKIGNKLDLAQIGEDDMPYILFALESGGFDKIAQGKPVYDDSEFKRAVSKMRLKQTDARYKQAADFFNKKYGQTQERIDLSREGLEFRKEIQKNKNTGFDALLGALKKKATSK